MIASTTSLLWAGINGVLEFSQRRSTFGGIDLSLLTVQMADPGIVDPSIKNSHPEGNVDLEVISGYKGQLFRFSSIRQLISSFRNVC
jgi:hypothetical protein